MAANGKEAVRIEGPTPNGYAYALVCEFEDGSIHITEYDAEGKGRLCTMALPPEQPTGTAEAVRIEGPTPNGGAYAMAVEDDDGMVHIIECDADGKSIRSTLGYTTRSKSDTVPREPTLVSPA